MLQTYNENIPISRDEGGVMRIAGTRVTLDCIVEMFDDGASPEEIVEQYDALQLDDVYAVITYYLRHRDEVRDYLLGQADQADEARRAVEQPLPNTLRAKLLKAKRERDSGGR